MNTFKIPFGEAPILLLYKVMANFTNFFLKLSW
jgi:hypothetical protein